MSEARELDNAKIGDVVALSLIVSVAGTSTAAISAFAIDHCIALGDFNPALLAIAVRGIAETRTSRTTLLERALNYVKMTYQLRISSRTGWVLRTAPRRPAKSLAVSTPSPKSLRCIDIKTRPRNTWPMNIHIGRFMHKAGYAIRAR